MFMTSLCQLHWSVGHDQCKLTWTGERFPICNDKITENDRCVIKIIGIHCMTLYMNMLRHINKYIAFYASLISLFYLKLPQDSIFPVKPSSEPDGGHIVYLCKTKHRHLLQAGWTPSLWLSWQGSLCWLARARD